MRMLKKRVVAESGVRVRGQEGGEMFHALDGGFTVGPEGAIVSRDLNLAPLKPQVVPTASSRRTCDGSETI